MDSTQDILLAQNAQRIFEHSLDLPEADREAYIKAQCGDNEALLAQVNLLIENEETGGGFVQNLYGEPQEDEGFALVGQNVGPYTLVDKLGRGGMAEVYLARRSDGVHEGEVAIKIIQGMGRHKSLISRFHRERKILGNLKHPNIAQMFDGGNTEQGLPYFVMEYVEGQRLDGYCKEHQLSVKARLQLFLKICAAVTFAHSSLVIHRDLKPANILVDKHGEPKLLDFGIAKLIDQEKEDDLTVTELAMTPHYASPEQLRGEVLTTASDVFSLGVVLYELLSGVRPNRFIQPSPLGYQTENTSTNIPSPSKAVLNSLDDATVAKKLSTVLKGDLDTIVLKLLRMEPERRYASVQALTDDIERYLNHRPVLARKDSLWYRTQRFIQRNAAMIAVVGIASLVLVASVGYQQHRILNERDVAIEERNKYQQTQEFLIELFRTSDPNNSRGNEVTARELLDKGVEKIRSSFDEQLSTKAELLATMGVVYLELGLYKESIAILQEQVAIVEKIEPNSVALVRAFSSLGWAYMAQGDFRQGEQTLNRALNMCLTIAPDDMELGRIYYNLGSMQVVHGKIEEGRLNLEKGMELNLVRLQPNDKAIPRGYSALASYYAKVENYEKALDYEYKSLALFERLYGGDNLNSANVYDSLSSIYAALGDEEAAYKSIVKQREIYEKIFETDNPHFMRLYTNLGNYHIRKGEPDAALSFFEKVEALGKRFQEKNSIDFNISYINIAGTYYMQGKYDASLSVFKKTRENLINNSLQDHFVFAVVHSNMGEVYDALGEYEKALEYLSEAVRLFQKQKTRKSSVAETYFNMGKVYQNKKQYQNALSYYEKALDIQNKAYGPDRAETKRTLSKIEEVKLLLQ